MGVTFDGKVRKDVVYRLKKVPQSPVKYPYIVASDKIEEPADILTINDFRRLKEKMKKKVKRGMGIEVLIAPARKMDAGSISKWLESIMELHSFCHSFRCQLVLSSGATSMHEMVSGPCLDAILRSCDIDPQMHWFELNSWLEAKLSRRVSV